jgi:hypothetical protein
LLHRELAGYAPCGATRRQCAPLCNRACVAALWPSRGGDEAAPGPIGFKSPTNRHPGRKHIGACNKKAGVRGSVIHRKPCAGSRSVSRGRRREWRSTDRGCGEAGLEPQT